MERFLRLSLLLAILSVISCTRKGAKDATLKFQLPAAAKSSTSSKPMFLQQAKVTGLSDQHWGSNDPGLLSDINCYAVLIHHAPQDAVNTCTGAGVPAFNVSQAAGLYPAGSTVELDVPSGPAQTFYLLGLKASNSADCSMVLDRSLALSHFSHPVLIAKTTVDITPGVNEISMNASMIGAAPLASCIGPTASFGETAPLAFITSPADGSFISAANAGSFILNGTCSEEGQLVRIDGPVTTTAPCTDQSWTAELNLTSLLDGSVGFEVSQASPSGVKGPVNARQFIKDTSAPHVAITSPNVGSLVGSLLMSHFTIKGTCSENGRTIDLLAPGLSLPAATCSNNAWTASLDLSSVTLETTVAIQAQITDTAGNSSTSNILSLLRSNGSAAHLTLSGDSQFSDVIVGSGPSAVHTFTLTNEGGTQATTLSVPLPAPFSFVGGSYPGTNGTCGSVLAAHANCQIAVQFTAQSTEQSSSGPLPVSYYDGTSMENLSITLNANSVTPASLTFTPSSSPLDFGTIQTGSSASQQITLNNNGGATATGLLFISISPLGTPFSIQNNQCGSSLAGHSHCTFQVRFAPMVSGNYTASEPLTYQDGQISQTLTLNLKGRGSAQAMLVISDLTISNVTKTGFDISVKYTGDENTNATVSAAYCKEVSGFCDPSGSPDNITLTRQTGAGLFTGTVAVNQTSYHPFDKIRVKAMALDADGVSNQTAETSAVLATTFTKVAAGDNHTCAIRKGDQQILCWGDNTNGQLGQSGAPTAPSTVGLLVTNPVTGQKWTSIDAGGNTTCAIDTNQKAYCWGYGAEGELGNSTLTTSQTTPVPVSGSHQWSKISVGEDHVCGLATDGHVYCWGNNTYGQLGNNATTPSNMPVEVDGSHTYIDVSAGGTSSCGVRSDHYGMCWGQNNLGQLGDNTYVDNSQPVYVSGSSRFLKIVVGRNHVEGINDDTNVLFQFMYGWGDNTKKELGVGSDYSGYTVFGIPTALNPAYGQWSRFALGNQFSCGIRTVYPSEVPGRVSCWGDNSYDQMGGASVDAHADNPVAVIDKDQVEIATGAHYACTVDSTGYLHCWGDNAKGQLGDGTTTQINTPKLVSP